MTTSARTSTTLGLASLTAGVLAYVVFAVLTRQLGAQDAAPVSVLWTWWGLSAAALSFPLQHWIVQLVTHHGGFAVVRRALPAVVGIGLALSVLAGAGSWVLRDPLFHRDDLAFPVLTAGLTAGSVLMGVLRGVLTARAHYTGLALSLVGEHVARVTPIVVLALLDVRDPAAYGTVLVLGSYLAVLWPPALRLPATGSRSAKASFALLSSAASGQLLAQVVLTSGPIVLALQGGAPAEVTALFVALAVFRAPLILAQGMVSPLTARWTLLATGGRTAEIRRVRVGILLTAVLGASSAALVGAWLGPPVIRLVFGEAVDVDPLVAGVVAGGSMLAVANIGAMVLAIALSSAGRTVVAWGVAALVGVAVSLGGGDPATRTAVAFAVAEVAALVVLSVGLRAAAVRAVPSTP